MGQKFSVIAVVVAGAVAAVKVAANGDGGPKPKKNKTTTSVVEVTLVGASLVARSLFFSGLLGREKARTRLRLKKSWARPS